MLESYRIGHADNDEMGTGVTVIICENGAVGGVSVRGSAPATRETDLLRPGNSVNKANAIVLSGGSAFGLEAACGVVQYLNELNIGYPTGSKNVPIVCGASLYDLEYKSTAYPDKIMGYEACINAATNNFNSGMIGAGKGATIGKIMGAMSSVKSGLGVATITLSDGVEMCAVVAVNAFGDVYDYKTGKRVKGANFNNNEMPIIDTMLTGSKLMIENSSNTTIGCIFTNAKLNKEQANKLADITHDGYAMTIRPVHTMVDGDCIFALSSGEAECNFMVLSSIAPILMAEAVLNAVK